jgi:hypothetical protein
MFDHIGSKIKTLATILTVIGIVLSFFCGLTLLLNEEGSGLVIMILGSLCSWLGSFLLYGFGQLIENSDKIVELLAGNEFDISPEAVNRPSSDSQPLTDDRGACAGTPTQKPADWVCFACGNSNFHNVQFCQHCGVSKYWSEEKHAEARAKVEF